MSKFFLRTLIIAATSLVLAAPVVDAAPDEKRAKNIESQARATFERALEKYKTLPALRFEAQEFVQPEGGVRTVTPIVGVLGRNKFKVLTYAHKVEKNKEPNQLQKVSTLNGAHFYVWEEGEREFNSTLEYGELTSALEMAWLEIPFVGILYDFWTGKNPLEDPKFLSAKWDSSSKNEDKVSVTRALTLSITDEEDFFFERSTGLLSRVIVRRGAPESFTVGLNIKTQRAIQPLTDTFQWLPK